MKGNSTRASGATLAPGGSLNTLIFNDNLTLSGGSTTLVEISGSPAANDSAQVAGNLILNGTLVITNDGVNSLNAGDRFKLFSAGSYSGAFTNIQPVVPQPGLRWDVSELTNGILKIAAAPPPVIGKISIAGTNLIFSGTNAPANETYWLLSSTNLDLPLRDWPVVSTNNFDRNGGFDLTNPVGKSSSQMFYLLQLQ